MTRIARITSGSLLLVAGVPLLFLPGPGLLTIAAGLAVLSKDVAWAGRLADKIRQKAMPSRGSR